MEWIKASIFWGASWKCFKSFWKGCPTQQLILRFLRCFIACIQCWSTPSKCCIQYIVPSLKGFHSLATGSFHTKKNQKKILTLSDFFENWHTCLVHRETTPDQNLAYFDYLPLRYDWSIFEAIIQTLLFKQP